MYQNNLELMSTMTISEFRAFRKALAVLLRARVLRETAIDILLEAYRSKTRFSRTA